MHATCMDTIWGMETTCQIVHVVHVCDMHVTACNTFCVEVGHVHGK